MSPSPTFLTLLRQMARMKDDEIWALAVFAVGVAGARSEEVGLPAVNVQCHAFVQGMHDLVGTPPPPLPSNEKIS